YIHQQYLINKNNKHPQKLAIVLDIDETSLSNYDKMVKRDFTGSKEQIHKEILAANSPAIKPMLTLYKNALKQGIKVFFVTGRQESERDATRANLIKAGYTKWAGLYLRPNGYSSPSIIPFKSKAREMIAKKGYTIIASIGDQCSDIQGGYAKKGFKLPNPFYYLP
ncbi:TPA: HAD family acid phosphatase, partial [Legionella pneumophila]|nr:acid phosphatase [Legionella pneumophila]HDU8290031.1 acid phosphatase [Legionella pneumophila]